MDGIRKSSAPTSPSYVASRLNVLTTPSWSSRGLQPHPSIPSNGLVRRHLVEISFPWEESFAFSRTCQHEREVALYVTGSPDRNCLCALLCYGSFIQQIKRQWCLICVPDLWKVLPMQLNISGSGKATNVKFGGPIQRDGQSKSPWLFGSRNGHGHVTWLPTF